jgi:putative transposase
MKYRKKLLYKQSYQEKLKELVAEIAERYWYVIHRLGTDGDHIHILLQAVPSAGVPEIVKTIKSITAREMYRSFPELKKLMWGTSLWEQGYFVRTVGDETTAEMIKRYIEKQGKVRGVKAEQLRFI